jgi:hypothetical protein
MVPTAPSAAEIRVAFCTAVMRVSPSLGPSCAMITRSRAGSEASEGLLFTEVDSWMTGINRNVEGKQVRRIMRYSGGHPKFRERCEAVAANGYREMALA